MLYLSRASESRVVVVENQVYRFLLMDNAIQSVMSRHDPARIVFPHQQEMLRPLATLAEGARVLELGLGGGSALRHASFTRGDLNWTSVEQSAEVISVFWDYFSAQAVTESAAPMPINPHHEIVLDSSEHYLQNRVGARRFELILCDVYDVVQHRLLDMCLQHIEPGGMLVVNWLPHMQPQGENSSEFFSLLTTRGKQATGFSFDHQVALVEGFGNQIHTVIKGS